MNSQIIHRVMAVLAFLAAILFYINKNYSIGALWTAMGIVFISLDAKK